MGKARTGVTISQEGADGISDEALKSQLEECYQRAETGGGRGESQI